MSRTLALDAQTVKRSFQLMGLLMVFACSSFGRSITFTDVTTASGTIGLTSFTSDPITISAVGDTSSIQSFTGGFSIDDSSASVTIGGVGTFLLTTGTRFFVTNSLELVGFSRAGINGSDLIDGPTNSEFSSWAMLTSIGPITGAGEIFEWTLSPVITSGGTLVLDDASPDVTFSAQVGSVTPEPSTFLLFGPALLGIGRFVKRKIPS
jgi:hypothetical protein